MKRSAVTAIPLQDKIKEHRQCIAFHEAGHAAAIYLNNKANNLPPVFFQIIFKDIKSEKDYDVTVYQVSQGDCIAKVEGGRLIESLPPSVEGLVHKLTEHNASMVQLVEDFMTAFETDIINLLIGPLAEARYMAATDNEAFNQHLISLKALKNYGGTSDLALANEYLQSLSACKDYQVTKLDDLFKSAFKFINDNSNWKAVTKLANYILKSNKNIISCEEVALVLEQ
ncbi:conserved hypothetical protein [Candidatus Methylobacter favarea]|uniref:Peptidase M41 domain-containing protein n=1 Tax=Candidatus Methylobacter favarea TaxID=2707345 RepID=A0A8S0WS47_9GAMM|nr:hypothetical protein [Candidatus Methylobacter favarea]CAA9892481.1 conserved hypothetical protein [Candidatus Methylobacter favarea]